MKRILCSIGGVFGLLVMVALFAMLITGAYLDLTDPRPRAGTPECEAAQVVVLSREPNRNKTPARFLQEVNDACKS